MRNWLKIVGLLFGVLLLVVAVIAINMWLSNAKYERAKKSADYIIENLDKEDVHNSFPPEYFPKEQIKPFLGGVREKCDWKNRDGKFVDFFALKNKNEPDQTAFIYEFHLDCDSLRFILTYQMIEQPKLMGFKYEPLENHNPLILFPEKQLKNR